MSSDNSVTVWIQELKEGKTEAAQRLWERYVYQLVNLARNRLQGRVRRVTDEQDVVQEAFEAFFQAVKRGAITKLADRDDLWQLLCVIVDHKLRDRVRFETRLRRGGGNVRGDSVFQDPQASHSAGLDGLAGPDDDPAFVAETIEQVERLLQMLDPDRRQIALLKLQGYTNEEIAGRLDFTVRTIERKLKLIRGVWERAGWGPV